MSNQAKNPDLNEPAALIRLEEQQGYRYYRGFGNFGVITRWNRSRRFAMVVQELARRIQNHREAMDPHQRLEPPWG